jgi:hypothetical protein
MRTSRVFLLSAVLAWIVGFSGSAVANGPALGSDVYPFEIGISVHHGTFIEQPVYNLNDTIKALGEFGFESFRDDFGWSFLEDAGDSGFPEKLQALYALLEAMKGRAKPLLALTLGSPIFNGGTQPTTDDAQDRYARSAATAVKLGRPYGAAFEIWNEWNLGTGTRKRIPGTPESYVSLVKKAYPAMKQENPDALVMAGAMATDLDPVPFLNRDWVWTRRALELGLLDNTDALSVHLYNTCRRDPAERRPSELIERLRKLIALVDEFKPGQAFPIEITEVGWPNPARGCGYSEDQQISYISQFLISLTQFPSVKGVWLYELKDLGNDHDTNLEHNFGLLTSDYKPKPYLCGYVETTALLKFARFKTVTTNGDGSVAFELTKGDQAVRVVWQPDPQTKTTYVVPAGSAARFVCDPSTYAAGSSVDLRERPLIVQSGS